MQKNTIFIIIVVTSLLFTVGYFTGQIMSDYANKQKLSDQNLQKSGNTYSDGWSAAEQRLKTIGLIPPDSEKVEYKKVSGEISKIDDNMITLKIRPLEALADPSLDERIVKTTSTTSVTKLVLKKPEVLRDELEAFRKLSQKPNVDPRIIESYVMPDAYIRTPAVLSDLRTGFFVQVVTNDNIKAIKEFFAKEINFYQ
jgi:hypothetical protein